MNGTDNQTTYSGRVEVRRPDGKWGNVCDDDFDSLDAKVICKMLGYKSATPKVKAFYGKGINDIWMDDLRCKGSENSIFDCDYSGWNTHNCQHHEDAGVECEGALISISGGIYYI